MNAHKDNRRAFTLVELLAVIAIVAALGGVLIPVIGSIRQGSHQAACASNLRQIGLALQLYANDHGHYPETAHENSHDVKRAWVYTLSDYLERVDEVRICPADPKGDLRLRDGGSSYILNGYVFQDHAERNPFSLGNDRKLIRPSMIPNPSKTLFAFIISDSRPTGPQDDHSHTTWTHWNAVLGDIQPNRHGGRKDDFTSGSANYLFADGHVESIQAIDVKRDIDRGINIAAIQ